MTIPGELIPLIIVPTFFSLVALIYWLAQRTVERRAQLRHELGLRTLERFSSPEELARFFESDAGRRFIHALEATEITPAQRILRTLRAGIVFATLGLGFSVLELFSDDEAGFIYPGVLLLCLGLGFILAAVVSHKLHKSGALERADDRALSGYTPYREEA